MNYRRKKMLTGDVDDGHLGTSYSGSNSSFSSTELHRFSLKVVSDGNEETTVRKALAASGVHVVQAKADIDILSNTSKGVVNVVIRDGRSTDEVRRLVDQVATRVH